MAWHFKIKFFTFVSVLGTGIFEKCFCIKQLLNLFTETLKSIYMPFLNSPGDTQLRQLRKGTAQLREAEEGRVRVEEVRYQGERGGRPLDGQASLG